MEKENNIAAFFKKKLEAGSKSPSDGLWNRIEDSLDKDDKQRKGYFIFWITAIGIPTLLTAGWLMVVPTDNLTPYQQNSDTEIKLDSITAQDTNIKAMDSVINNTIFKHRLTKKDSVSKPKAENTNTKISRKSDKKGTRDKKEITSDGYSVKSTYHYFNSDSGEHIETSNKADIDSLMRRKDLAPDSSIKVIHDKVDLIQLKDSL